MFRFFYLCLLRLHPRTFRQRFAEEMVAIFDETTGKRSQGLLLADALVSLGRQWVLRRGSRRRAFAGGVTERSYNEPVFHTFESFRPHRGILTAGAVLSLVFFGAITFTIGRGGRPAELLIGARHPRRSVLPVQRSSIQPADPTTDVKIRDPVDPWRKFAAFYFNVILALRALDADEDLVISALEIANAAASLKRLDRDQDGRLTPEECGHYLGEFGADAEMDAHFAKLTGLAFMRLNPVLAALDVDGSGEVSAGEINGSSAALKHLDKNADRSLTINEVVPERVQNQIRRR